jgi:methyltransferase
MYKSIDGCDTNYLSENYYKLKPLFKYPGGKSSEYKYLKNMFPSFDIYLEPFLGGGAVYWAVEAKEWVINDLSKEVVAVYQYCKVQDSFFLGYLEDISIIWKEKANYIHDIKTFLFYDKEIDKDILKKISLNLLNTTQIITRNYDALFNYLYSSILRRKKILIKLAKKEEIKNLDDNALGILGSALYMYFRDMYNNTDFTHEPQLKTSLYLFVREYSYSSMFRFNSEGLFNVPFGGNTYAKKDFFQRFKQITNDRVIKKLQKTTILQKDFSEIFVDKEKTFMFLDPPYDTEFNTYNLHIFDLDEQVRLRDELKKIKHTKWLMVIKSTVFIEDLYNQEGWYKCRFDKSYSVNFKNRNIQNAQHLIVTNYKLEGKK